MSTSDARGLAWPEVQDEGLDEGGSRQDRLGGVQGDEVDRDQRDCDPRHRVTRATGILALPSLKSGAAEWENVRVLPVEAAPPVEPVENLPPDPDELTGPVLFIEVGVEGGVELLQIIALPAEAIGPCLERLHSHRVAVLRRQADAVVAEVAGLAVVDARCWNSCCRAQLPPLLAEAGLGCHPTSGLRAPSW